jgi:SAM-dependent methyltransferase
VSIADQRAYYDERWAAAPEELDEHQAARLAAIRAALRLVIRRTREPRRILEVGYGTGWLASELAAHGKVTGLDLSEAAIELARTRYPGQAFDVLDASTARLPGGNDLVVASDDRLGRLGFSRPAERALGRAGYGLCSLALARRIHEDQPDGWGARP